MKQRANELKKFTDDNNIVNIMSHLKTKHFSFLSLFPFPFYYKFCLLCCITYTRNKNDCTLFFRLKIVLISLNCLVSVWSFGCKIMIKKIVVKMSNQLARWLLMILFFFFFFSSLSHFPKKKTQLSFYSFSLPLL